MCQNESKYRISIMKNKNNTFSFAIYQVKMEKYCNDYCKILKHCNTYCKILKYCNTYFNIYYKI